MTKEEKMAPYIDKVRAYMSAAEAEGVHPQEYINKNPGILQTVGNGDQTELIWLQDENDKGEAMIVANGFKWYVTNVTYQEAKEQIGKYFPEEKALKWYPLWAEEAYMIAIGGGGCGGCGGGCSCSK